MFRRVVVSALTMSFVLASVAAPASQAPTIFKKVDFFVQEGEEMKEHDAQLIVDARRRLLIFAEEDHADRFFISIPWDRVTGVTYENSKHARITAGLLIAWPMLFLKGKKHWLTVTFGPAAGGEPGGYAFARMDKDNFQNILAAINGFTGQEVRRIEENGEISVLYVGRNTAPAEPVTAGASPAPVAASNPAASAAEPPPATAGVSTTLPAGALPPSSDNVVPAAPLPPPANALQPLVILNKGVQWTVRATGSVGFVWAAEVGNDNAVELETVVVLRLLDAAGAVLHEARQPITVPAGDVFSFTTEGEVPEAQAGRADRWAFEIEQPTGSRRDRRP